LLGDQLEKNMNANMPAFLRRITSAQWQVLIEDLLPPQQLQAMTEDALNKMLSFLNGETPEPRISFKVLKQSLSGPAGLNAALAFIASQPDCTIAQIGQIISSLGANLCNPPQAILGLIQPVIQTELQVASAAIPDEVSLIPSANLASAQVAIQRLRVARLIMRLSPLVPIIFLLLMTLLIVRSFRGWMAWWGWPLFLSGLVGALLGFRDAPILRRIAEDVLARQMPIVVPAAVAVAFRGVVDAAFGEMLKPAAWESLALFTLGLAMILIWKILAGKKFKNVAE